LWRVDEELLEEDSAGGLGGVTERVEVEDDVREEVFRGVLEQGGVPLEAAGVGGCLDVDDVELGGVVREMADDLGEASDRDAMKTIVFDRSGDDIKGDCEATAGASADGVDEQVLAHGKSVRRRS
jgi:hypothetical protein